MARRVLPPLKITEAERTRLQEWSRSPTTAQSLALRARIVLTADRGLTNKEVVTAGKWRERFIHKRLDGLLDEPRPGAPRRIGDELIERILSLTLESKPTGATHRSTRDMGRHVGISADSVHRIWRAFRLQPHRHETFKLSPDPLLIDKIRDIVGLYLSYITAANANPKPYRWTKTADEILASIAKACARTMAGNVQRTSPTGH